MRNLFLEIPTEILIFYVLMFVSVIVLTYFVFRLSRNLHQERAKKRESIDYGKNYISLIQNYPGMAYRCLIDEYWTMKFVSPKTYDLLEYTESEIVDNHTISYEDIIYPKYRSELRDIWDRCIANNDDFIADYQIVTKSGKLKWVHETGHAIYDKERNPIYLEGFIYDITEERELSVRERKSEAKYRNLIETSQDPIYIVENELIAYVNPACVSFLKAKSELDIIGKRVVDLITEEYVQFYHDRTNRLRQSMLPNPRAEYAFQCFDGSIAYGEVAASPYYDNGIISIHVLIRDITDRKFRMEQLKRIQKRNRDLIVQMTEGIGVFSNHPEFKEKQLLFANRSFSHILYGQHKRVLGNKICDIFPNLETIHGLCELSPGKEPIIQELKYQGNRYLELKFFTNEDNELILMIRDITENKHFEDSLKEERNRLRTIIQGTNTATWEWNLISNEISVNARWAEMIGYRHDELEPYTIQTWEKFLHPDDHALVSRELAKHLNGETDYYHVEVRMLHRDGHTIWILDRGSITKRDADGKPLVMSGTHQDISDRKLREMEVIKLSYFDHLTGLSNRRSFEEKLKELDSLNALPLSIVMADLDALKITNDAFGHQSGDELLIYVTSKIKSKLKNDYFCARTGGDEFVILLPGIDFDNTKAFVADINLDLESELFHGVKPSVSFGIATRHSLARNLSDVLKDAEMMMYNHKLSHSGHYRSEIVRYIQQTLFEKLPLEKEHAALVVQYATKLAKACALSLNDTQQLLLLAEVHDIGKIAIDPALLNKKEALTESDCMQLKKHAETGYRILSSSYRYDKIASDVLCHHEYWNGSGYPKHLKQTEIPWNARAIAICEAYAAMMQDYPYRASLSNQAAIRELKDGSGVQFDPELVTIFIAKVLESEADETAK